MRGWTRISEEAVSEGGGLEGSLKVLVHRKALPHGWLVMTTMIHDRRNRLGALDLSTKWDRLMSVRTHVLTTFVPDPDKNWKIA